MPSAEQLQRQINDCSDRLQREKLHRALLRRQAVGPGPKVDVPVWLWRIGRTLVLGFPVEAYSQFQVDLRAALPDFAVVVMNVCNGFAYGYVSPDAVYDKTDIYQINQTPFARGCYEKLLAACERAARELIDAP